MIDVSKKYKTANGLDARILCTDAPGPFPVRVLICESVLSYPSDGIAALEIPGSYNLVEVSPYADFKIDDPVMVRDRDGDEWMRRHFYGCGGGGRARTWNGGQTSWTSEDADSIGWDQCRRPTAEELAS